VWVDWWISTSGPSRHNPNISEQRSGFQERGRIGLDAENFSVDLNYRLVVV
jgi:hypothetical protein